MNRVIPSLALTAALALGGGCSSHEAAQPVPTTSQFHEGSLPPQTYEQHQQTLVAEANQTVREAMDKFRGEIALGGANVTYDEGNCMEFLSTSGNVFVKNPALYSFKTGNNTITTSIFEQTIDGSINLTEGPFDFHAANGDEMNLFSVNNGVIYLHEDAIFKSATITGANSTGQSAWLDDKSQPNVRISETRIVTDASPSKLNAVANEFCGEPIGPDPTSQTTGTPTPPTNI